MLQIVRRSFQEQGLSEDIIEVLLAAWRDGTVKQYKSTLGKWTTFCAKTNRNVFRCSVVDVLEFLNTMNRANLSYSAINSARSALSAFVVLEDGSQVGTHPLISKFLKGIFNTRPPVPRYSSVWDVRLVLNLLRSWSPVATLSLKTLSQKLCMLIALLDAPRVQTLKALNLVGLEISGSKISFKIANLLKTNRQGRKVGKEVSLAAYPPDRRLCVLTVLRQYIAATKTLRGSEQQLFISYIEPHDAVSKDTLARWIKEVLTMAGINTSVFKAHSTRAASVSAASAGMVPTSEIIERASWTNEATFRKYYRKPIDKSENYQNAVLGIV